MIGPTFNDELVAAGIKGWPFSWSEAGLGDVSQLSDDELARVEAVLAAHDPARQSAQVVELPVIDLYRRMTDDEYARMQAGVATQSPRVQGIFARAVNFRSDAPEWSLLNAMAVQLYGKDRAAELLTP